MCGDVLWELAADTEVSWESSVVWEQVESNHHAVASGSQAGPRAAQSCGLDDPRSLAICYPMFHLLKKMKRWRSQERTVTLEKPSSGW